MTIKEEIFRVWRAFIYYFSPKTIEVYIKHPLLPLLLLELGCNFVKSFNILSTHTSADNVWVKKKLALSIALIACLLVSILSYELLFAQSPPNTELQDNGNEQETPTPTNTVNPTETPTRTHRYSEAAPRDGGVSPTINPTTSPTNTPVPDTSKPALRKTMKKHQTMFGTTPKS